MAIALFAVIIQHQQSRIKIYRYKNIFQKKKHTTTYNIISFAMCFFSFVAFAIAAAVAAVFAVFAVVQCSFHLIHRLARYYCCFNACSQST